MSRFDRALTRAFKPSLGNLKSAGSYGNSSGGKGKGPVAGTRAMTWSSPNTPMAMDQDIQQFGQDSYQNNVYVMRCIQTIANTIAGLEFRAGVDPEDPANFDPAAPLAQLLGPSTVMAPGGPNPETSSRAFWAWTICQYLVYGRWAWECQLDGPGGLSKKQIVALWALVAGAVQPIPTMGGQRLFDGYQYQTPMGLYNLKHEQVIYAWRPSLTDWRQPETVMTSAKLPIYIANGMNRYMAKLLQNDMVATTLVVSPPFEEDSGRRAWQEQFNAQFSGIDNKGRTIFAEAEADEEDPVGKPLVQVERIAQTAVEASMIQLHTQANIDITIAFGVPVSLIGNASQRTYANADSEYKNFWTITVLPLITEIQDHVNTVLAGRVGQEVGWFDLSRVAALKPPSVIAPAMVGDLVMNGVASAAQIANMLQIPAADATTDADTDTVELGEESATPGPQGGGARSVKRLGRVSREQLLNAYAMYQRQPVNTHTLNRAFHEDLSRWLTRAHIDIEVPKSTPVQFRSQQATGILESVERVNDLQYMKRRAERLQAAASQAELARSTALDIRAAVVTTRLAKTVHDKLSKSYPESTLHWVDEANWSGPSKVKLDDIDMARRPGGRDQAKVAGIAQGIAKGEAGAVAPVVLVNTPGDDKLQIADGYHRTLAHQRLKHGGVDAYVGEVDSDEGPWQEEMHSKKLNRAIAERSPTQDNDAYREGVNDHVAAKPKLSKAQFESTHPGFDADDYPLYEAGYAADTTDLHFGLVSREDWIEHLANDHVFDAIDLDATREDIEMAHDAAHAEGFGHRDDGPQITVFDGGDFDTWFDQNSAALEQSVVDV